MTSDRSFNEALRSAIREEIAPLRADIGTLRTDVGTLKEDVGTLKADVDTLKTDVGTLTVRVDTLTGRVDTLTGRMDNLSEDVATLRPLPERVQQLSTQVGALAGVIEVGFTVIREDIGELRQRVSALEAS